MKTRENNPSGAIEAVLSHATLVIFRTLLLWVSLCLPQIVFFHFDLSSFSTHFLRFYPPFFAFIHLLTPIICSYLPPESKPSVILNFISILTMSTLTERETQALATSWQFMKTLPEVKLSFPRPSGPRSPDPLGRLRSITTSWERR